jgi:surface antigen
MRTLIIAMLLCTTLISGGCATHREGGTAVGATAGGALGYAVGGGWGLLFGAVLGGAVGHTIGAEMDKQDQMRVAMALEANQAAQWRNANTGNTYTVQPGAARVQNNRECRDFRVMADVEGRAENVNGVACRHPETQQWEIVSG